MKYTVFGFQQDKLLEKKLNTNDALVLRTIVDMYASNSQKIEYRIIGNEKYMWLKVGYLLELIPIVGSEKTLRNCIKRLEGVEALQKVIKNSKDGISGKFQFLAPGRGLQYLLEYVDDETGEVKGQIYRRPPVETTVDHRSNLPDKDTSINIYTSNKNNTLSKEKQEAAKVYTLPASKPKKKTGTTGPYLQKAKELLAGYKIKPSQALMYAEGDIKRIKEAVEYAKEYNKGAGWIIGCIKEGYDLSYKPKQATAKKEEARSLDMEKATAELDALYREG